MAGLPHFTSAKAAVQLYEPVYLNQFEVIIQPPAGVALEQGNGGRSLLVENVLSVTGLTVDKNPTPAEQRYKFTKRRYAGGVIDDTGVKVRIEFIILYQGLWEYNLTMLEVLIFLFTSSINKVMYSEELNY